MLSLTFKKNFKRCSPYEATATLLKAFIFYPEMQTKKLNVLASSSRPWWKR